MDNEIEKLIFSELKYNLTDILDISDKKITPNSNLENDLHMDSLDRFEFAFRVEGDFGIQISDGDIAGKLTTVKDYINYIQTEKYCNK